MIEAVGPSEHVLTAFGVTASAVRLQGGEDRSWRAGDFVFKQVADIDEAGWVAEVLAGLAEDGFRVQRPVRARDGAWTAFGWTAYRWVDGVHDLRGRWPEVLEVGAHFHSALRDLARPTFLDRRTHPWSVGDRAAWGETVPELLNPAFAGILDRFYGFLKPVGLTNQVIHGDLPGNILFAHGKPPAVIDFSPYYRPVGFALAVVIVDAIAWYGASPDLIGYVEDLESLDQLIARAAIFRLVTADTVSPSRPLEWSAEQVRAHLPILELIDA